MWVCKYTYIHIYTYKKNFKLNMLNPQVTTGCKPKPKKKKKGALAEFIIFQKLVLLQLSGLPPGKEEGI
jgi:hypothetical protein